MMRNQPKKWFKMVEERAGKRRSLLSCKMIVVTPTRNTASI